MFKVTRWCRTLYIVYYSISDASIKVRTNQIIVKGKFEGIVTWSCLYISFSLIQKINLSLKHASEL